MISNTTHIGNSNEGIDMNQTNDNNQNNCDSVSVEMLDVELTRHSSESEARKDLGMTRISTAINNDCTALSGKGLECSNPTGKANDLNKIKNLFNVRQISGNSITADGSNTSAPCAESFTTACSSSNKVSNPVDQRQCD